ncbi:anterior gradient protein 2 homolog [Gouania willdenowi]|uniref:Anterior gradient protein 2 homolog n=1 Tax=Gouania willdenowi TaxID=441366 RepID=A0A8C5NBW3_GOUWI|nr:anterior gradient protein 2 homolog [Gouania willdenowi]XP_028291672.1 anterior gradient protein 2 homolog [Gouania willdenowi]
MMLRWVILALLIGVCVSVDVKEKKEGEKSKKSESSSRSRGWGKDLKWAKDYVDALGKTTKSHKPLMVIHHLEDCPHSKALKKAFAEDKTIQKMAKDDFVMLNVVEETTDRNLAPDGYYVPRIIFVDPLNTVRADIIGRYPDRKYAYSPTDLELLAENMKKVVALKHTEL